MANENELKKIVLLIEDEIDLVDLYTEILNEAGYDVLPSFDGDDGIYKAKNDNWDIMLLDIITNPNRSITAVGSI